MAVESLLAEKFEAARTRLGVDVRAYSAAVGQEFASPQAAFAHYAAAGTAAQPELFPFIDPVHYGRQLDGELPASMSVFEHYVTEGAQRGLNPFPLFDLGFIRAQSPDIGYHTIFDYLGSPESATVDPHPFFSRRFYSAFNEDVGKAGADPFQHFARHGWRERRAIHPFFRGAEYLRFKLPIQGSASEFFAALMAALRSPELAFRQPLFDAEYYVQSLHPDEAVDNPLQHFIAENTGESGFPLFDLEFFLSQKPDIRAGVNPYIEYLGDFSHSIAPHKYMDPEYYVRTAPVDAGYRGSLLEHFVDIGAGSGARLSPRVITLNARPRDDSGWSVLQPVHASSGRQYWLCGPNHQSLLPHLSDIASLEPAVRTGLLNWYNLHPHSGPVDRHGQMMISTVTKIARCNCLVISETALDDDLIAALHSPAAGFTSSARPWLTLLACSGPRLRYSHPIQGASVAAPDALGGDVYSRARFMSEMAITAMPNRLVVAADRLGIELLRAYGTQLLAAIPDVAILVGLAELDPPDLLWFEEYLLVNCGEFTALAVRDSPLGNLPTPLRQAQWPGMPRIISL